VINCPRELFRRRKSPGWFGGSAVKCQTYGGNIHDQPSKSPALIVLNDGSAHRNPSPDPEHHFSALDEVESIRHSHLHARLFAPCLNCNWNGVKSVNMSWAGFIPARNGWSVTLRRHWLLANFNCLWLFQQVSYNFFCFRFKRSHVLFSRTSRAPDKAPVDYALGRAADRKCFQPV